MSNRTLRSSSLAVTFIARQFGVRINADFVEDALQQGTLSNPKEFAAFFARQRVLTKPRRSTVTDLIEKAYLFPCIGLMKNGQSLILVGVDSAGDEGEIIISVDPTDPTAKPERTEIYH